MTNKTFFIDGKIPAILYEPADKKTEAVVIFFHGRDEDGAGDLASLSKLVNNSNHQNLIANAEKYGFRVLAPQVSTKITGVRWWTMPFIEQIINYALTTTSLPKVAVSGLSQGGGTTWMALTNADTAPKIFAAIPICPTSQYDGDFKLIAKYKIAVWDFHGSADTNVPVASSRVMVAKANAENPDPKVKYDEIAGASHFIWGQVYGRDDLYPWLISYAPKVTEPIPPIDPLPVDEIVSVHKITYYKSGKATLEKL